MGFKKNYLKHIALDITLHVTPFMQDVNAFHAKIPKDSENLYILIPVFEKADPVLENWCKKLAMIVRLETKSPFSIQNSRSCCLQKPAFPSIPYQEEEKLMYVRY